VLSVERKWLIVVEHFLQPFVDLCLCLSVQCIVVKRLMGYGCSLGWLCQMGPRMRLVIGFRDWSTGWGNLGANVGCSIVTNGEFAVVRLLSKSLWGLLVLLYAAGSRGCGVAEIRCESAGRRNQQSKSTAGRGSRN